MLMMMFLCYSNAEAQSNKVILAIFAHPDDESIVSPVLAKYAAAGATVYLVVATDGRYGSNDHAKIPEGDTLAGVREKEIACAAQSLGVKPPILLGAHDQMKAQEGFDANQAQFDLIRNKVSELFTTLKPDVVITWGPSGWTSHSDHRLVGAIVTEVFQTKVWGRPSNIFYPELATGTVANSPFPVATADSAFLPVRIPLSTADYDKAAASLRCHKSQYTQEQFESLGKLAWESRKGVIYFRPFIQKKKYQTSLFD